MSPPIRLTPIVLASTDLLYRGFNQPQEIEDDKGFTVGVIGADALRPVENDWGMLSVDAATLTVPVSVYDRRIQVQPKCIGVVSFTVATAALAGAGVVHDPLHFGAPQCPHTSVNFNCDMKLGNCIVPNDPDDPQLKMRKKTESKRIKEISSRLLALMTANNFKVELTTVPVKLNGTHVAPNHMPLPAPVVAPHAPAMPPTQGNAFTSAGSAPLDDSAP